MECGGRLRPNVVLFGESLPQKALDNAVILLTAVGKHNIMSIREEWSLMQVLKEKIKQNIIKESKELFLQKGFEMASMNMIAHKAGISKSNLYNYFSSKEEIFYLLTDQVNKQIEIMFDNILEHDYDSHFNVETFISLVSDHLGKLLADYREEVLLIVDCSKGTRFEDTVHNFIIRLQEHFLSELKMLNIAVEDDSLYFVEYLSTSMVEGLLGIIRHSKEGSWIKNNIKRFVNYYVRVYSYFISDFLIQ